MCQIMCCLVVCCDSQVHIYSSDASDKEEQQNHEQDSSQENISTFRETDYERDHHLALGGVEKLYQAARHYGPRQSQVI